MTETRADYVTAASDAIRAEAAQVRGIADWLLAEIHAMNDPAMSPEVWRRAVLQVYERLGEVVNNAD